MAIPNSLNAKALLWSIRLRGTSVKEAARKAGLPYDRVQRLLRNERPPRPGELERIARAIGVR